MTLKLFSLATYLYRNSALFSNYRGLMYCDLWISKWKKRMVSAETIWGNTVNYYLFQDVLQKLPSYCNGRIRSVAELQKFFGLYPEFHGKNELPYSPHQSHGATSKTNSPADFRQNSVSKFTKGQLISKTKLSIYWPGFILKNSIAFKCTLDLEKNFAKTVTKSIVFFFGL